jgi:hypothetical protein
MLPSPPGSLQWSSDILPSPSNILESISTIPSPPAGQALRTHEVLQDFAKVAQGEDPEALEEMLEQEIQDSRNNQLEETLRRLKYWYDEKSARAHASPLGLLGRMIERTLPKGFRLHEKPILPSGDELVKLAHHFYPPRGELKVEVFDFGVGRAERSQTCLAEITKCMKAKPYCPLCC